MAMEHEPGCDRQHTARQRCNQNALFAEQGEVPPNGAAPAAAAAPARKPTRTRRAAAPAEPTPPPAAMDEPPEPAATASEPEELDEIVSIREEVVVAEPELRPGPPDAEWSEEPSEAGVPVGLMIATALFGIVATMLFLLLVRGRGKPSGDEEPPSDAE